MRTFSNRIFLFFLFGFTVHFSFAQKNLSEQLLNEGKNLFRLEKASWFSTDHFLNNYPNKIENIGGYLSYENENGSITSLYYSKDEPATILARYQYAYEPQKKPLSIDVMNKKPSEQEKMLIAMRKKAAEFMHENKDQFFTFYDKTTVNLIPVVEEGKKQVYVLTAPKDDGVVLLGNDYLLEFNDNVEIHRKKKLHASLVDLPDQPQDDILADATLHTHQLSKYITTTDICTLLLYKDRVNWDIHYVVHKKFVSILDLKKESLVIMKRKDFEKLGKLK